MQSSFKIMNTLLLSHLLLILTSAWAVEPSSQNDRCCKLFVDPTGTHIIITTDNADNFIIDTNNQKQKKASSLSKWNFRIGALTFLHTFSKSGSDPIRGESEPLHGTIVPSAAAWTVLIGTHNGILYETTIDNKGKFTDVCLSPLSLLSHTFIFPCHSFSLSPLLCRS